MVPARARRLLVVLAAFSALLVPAAVAWACTPQAGVGTDKLSYEPGEAMTVSGRDFSGTTVTIATDPVGVYADRVPVSSAGTFETRLRAPGRPGLYTLVAKSSDTPFVARTAFEVKAPTLAPGKCANDKLGTARAERLSGTSAGDRILAFAGDDVLDALAADDCLYGGSGSDRLSGGLGNDFVAAQGGNDQAFGQDGNDRVYGADGDDRLSAGPGRDLLAGGSGADVLTDHLGDGQLYGEGGADKIYAGSGSFRIDAGNGNDYVGARNGRVDTVNCGPGRDTARVDRIDRIAGCERVIRG